MSQGNGDAAAARRLRPRALRLLRARTLSTQTRLMSRQPLTDITFESFDLHADLLSGLHASGFTRCTPIQALALPIALPGGDVAGQAQTGTGKTGAFLVAVLNRLLTRPARA